MYNTFIPFYSVLFRLLHYRLRYCDLPLQIPGPASAGLCQNRQASAPSLHYLPLLYAAQGTPRPFVRTDKQAPHRYVSCTSRCPGRTPGLLSEQTSKRPRTKGFKPIVVLPTAALRFAAAAWIPGHAEPFCQNRQASTL
jgi:hypothetical protein